jgi:hypothetical protein
VSDGVKGHETLDFEALILLWSTPVTPTERRAKTQLVSEAWDYQAAFAESVAQQGDCAGFPPIGSVALFLRTAGPAQQP